MGKLSIVHSECSLGWGGQEIRVFNEMKAFGERGYEVILCAPPESKIFQKASAAGIETVAASFERRDYPSSIFQLKRFFQKRRIDVVNTHSSRDGWVAGIAARWAGVPLVIRSRHIEVDYPNRLMSRIAFGKLPHHVLTTSEKISQRLIQELGLNPDRVTCVPTGIDLRRFHPGVARTVRQELGFGEDQILVGMISVLRSWKGHDYFLEAAQKIAVDFPNVHFLITGEGPRRRRIEELCRTLGIEKRATFLGHREDVPEVLAALDILVLPSFAHEGVPQIILQAQATGKAVIGTRVGGIPEVIQDGETGLLCEPKDAKDLEKKIRALLDNPERRRALGEKAEKKAQANYGIDRMCERLEAIYARYISLKKQ